MATGARTDGARRLIPGHPPIHGSVLPGGVIATDRAGNIALPFNTPGMYRAHPLAGQAPEIALFR